MTSVAPIVPVAPGPQTASAGPAASVAEAGPALRSVSGGVLLGVRVSPSARHTALRGVYGDRLKVSVCSPPEDNRANQELTDALANWLGMPRDKVRVETGHRSRDKVIVFIGMDEPELRQKLSELLDVDDRRRDGPPDG